MEGDAVSLPPPRPCPKWRGLDSPRPVLVLGGCRVGFSRGRTGGSRNGLARRRMRRLRPCRPAPPCPVKSGGHARPGFAPALFGVERRAFKRKDVCKRRKAIRPASRRRFLRVSPAFPGLGKVFHSERNRPSSHSRKNYGEMPFSCLTSAGILVVLFLAPLGYRSIGRTSDSGSDNQGSSPCSPANGITRPHRLAGPGQRPFTPSTGVQIPLGTPRKFKDLE